MWWLDHISWHWKHSHWVEGCGRKNGKHRRSVWGQWFWREGNWVCEWSWRAFGCVLAVTVWWIHIFSRGTRLFHSEVVFVAVVVAASLHIRRFFEKILMDATKFHNIFTTPLFLIVMGPSQIFYYFILIYEGLTH